MAFREIYQGYDFTPGFRAISDALHRRREYELEAERNAAARAYQEGLIEQQRDDRAQREVAAKAAAREKLRERIEKGLPDIFKTAQTEGQIPQAQALAQSLGGSLTQNAMPEVEAAPRMQLREPTMQIPPAVGGMAHLGLLPKLKSQLEVTPEMEQAQGFGEGMRRYARDYGEAAKVGQGYTLQMPDMDPVTVNPNAAREAEQAKRNEQMEALARAGEGLPDNVRADINLRRMLFGSNVDKDMVDKIAGAQAAEQGRAFTAAQGKERDRAAMERARVAAAKVDNKPLSEGERQATVKASRLRGIAGQMYALPTLSREDRAAIIQHASDEAYYETNPGKAALLQRGGIRKDISEKLSPEGRQVYGYMTEIATDILRKESGAAISAGEWKNIFNRYMPMPGEDEKDAARKRGLLESKIDEIAGASRAGYGGGEGAGPGRPKSPAAGAGDIVNESAARRKELQKQREGRR